MATQSNPELQAKLEEVKSLPLASNKPNDGVLTLESFEAAIAAGKYEAEHPQPHYSMLPEFAVDEYLKQGIIPRFVTVSASSMRKIRAYIKAHPEADTEVTDLKLNGSGAKSKGNSKSPNQSP